MRPEDGGSILSLNFGKIFPFYVANDKKLYGSMNTKETEMIVMWWNWCKIMLLLNVFKLYTIIKYLNERLVL
jgi:hypothetical protein